MCPTLRAAVSTTAWGTEALAESLLRLRDFEPDVVLWSGFVGDVSFAAVTRDEWKKAIKQASWQLNRRS